MSAQGDYQELMRGDNHKLMIGHLTPHIQPASGIGVWGNTKQEMSIKRQGYRHGISKR